MSQAARGPSRALLRPLVLAPAVALAVVGVAALLAAVTSGGAAALGAVAGGVVGVVVLALGAGAVALVARVLPAASLLVALLTYGLQLVLLVVALGSLTAGDVLGSEEVRPWLSGTLVAVVLAWTPAHLVAAVKQRVPVYDAPVNSPNDTSRTDADAGAR
ncbi:hypothetical protein [Nocardioides bruguierae]|uniref:ATP synthase protein I n=1 Tax=Nocardioides bruguierae TaxID=2945102 RepID=A0A9X2D558_9ACTN|nr:hypothetical protein [Nocardioides bruguierae]MCM0619189.1 hypothetical protein [Nocardioides bruguierae]